MTNTNDTELRDLRKVCDVIVERAAVLAVDEFGVPIPMLLDRLLTYAAAQAATMDGSERTASNFRLFADRIEAGLFHQITGEDRPHRGKH